MWLCVALEGDSVSENILIWRLEATRVQIGWVKRLHGFANVWRAMWPGNEGFGPGSPCALLD